MCVPKTGEIGNLHEQSNTIVAYTLASVVKLLSFGVPKAMLKSRRLPFNVIANEPRGATLRRPQRIFKCINVFQSPNMVRNSQLCFKRFPMGLINIGKQLIRSPNLDLDFLV